MKDILHTLVILPIAGFLVSLVIPRTRETLISRVAFLTVGLHLALAVGFVIYWLYNGHPTLDQKDMALIHTNSYEFFLDFSFDKIAATYLLVGAFLTFLVTVYSRYYMHREIGYKRFFNTMLFFYFGYVIVVLSGNLETMFVGWEMLGISSFLLIAFYRDRYLPVKNAVKVFSIYRVGDVGLILTMWLTHHLFHENITFLKMSNYALVHEHLATHSWVGVFISLMILITAAAKSAQLPFSSWLPRAMEGPTPSSAIFYGSLAVHVGVFLLLRTYPFWEHQLSVRILIGLVGLSTTVVTTGIARVQSSIKAQIAYASSAQIGLIFIEVAAGLENLALFHFAGNAFLRTYQLLVSPSVVSYLIREQFYNFVPRHRSIEDTFPKKLRYSLYILCLKEWNIDSFMYRYLWNPLKWLGRKLDFMTLRSAFGFFVPVYVIGLVSLYMEDYIPQRIHQALPLVFSVVALIAVLKSFTERKKARLSWTLVIMNHFWIALAISFNEHFGFEETLLYISGIVLAGILGFIVLGRLKGIEGNIDLDQFHGHSYKHPRLAFVFLVACLAATGFPITPTFVGEDLIFTHIHEGQVMLAFFVSLSFIIDGLAIIRIYARVFLGPHVKSVYEMAYRSS
jgi:NADH:ubiquinone oxidoreductase subunit 5 (subunit L)/multisubunit Na+/H+ antiporter MnhA subunit